MQQARPEQLLLSNGIPVILQHYESPVAATYWWVRTGSADEKPPEAGFAHFLEHMLFKDAAAKETGRASTGQTAHAIESLGGDINAYTSFDQTVYHVTCAAQHWEKVIDSFGPMAKPQKFLKSDFEREREVILEELRKNEDSPGRQLFQKVFSLTFKRHPYGRPVIGFVKSLKAAKVAEVEAFYRRQYVPPRMGLVLVGPLADAKGARRKAIIGRLEKHFGARVLPKRPAHPVLRTMEREIHRTPTFDKLAFDVKTPTFCVSFRAPELRHADIPALDLIAGILGMGELSRVYQHLFYQKSLVTDASGGLYVPNDPGMLYFQAEVPTIENVNVAAREMFQELNRFCDEGPTAEELQRVIVNVESDRLYATQTADGMAGRLGFLKFVMDDLEFDRKYLDELKSVDAARVRDVARRYLDYRRMSGVVMVPKDQETFDTSELGRLAQEHFSRAEKADAVKPVSVRASRIVAASRAKVERFTLNSGMQVVHFERPESHVFSVHGSALGGLRLEDERNWGVSHMLAMTWPKGTSTKDSQAIAREIEGRAANAEGFGGRNTVGLQMTGLARDWNYLSGLYGEMLFDSVFPEHEVVHSRRIVDDSLKGLDDHSSQLCSKLFLETLFEHHPYGRLTLGSRESIQKIGTAEIQACHRAWIRPERMVLAVSGAVNRNDLESWAGELDRRFGNLPTQGPGPSAAPPEEAKLKAPRWVERNLSREQTHIIVGGLGTHNQDEERFALRLMQTILAGQSGRLFIELREKKSLAYTVAPMSFEGIERGYVGTYIACSPGKREEAVKGMRDVLEKLAAKGPSANEIARAKEYFLGRRAMDLQSDASLAAHFGLEALYGLDRVTDEMLVKKVRSITAKQIQDVCRKYMVEPFTVTSTVG